jgi:hypothetical protein
VEPREEEEEDVYIMVTYLDKSRTVFVRVGHVVMDNLQ